MIVDEYRALADLKAHPRNYNKHDNPETLRRMCDKIRIHAFTAPFVINPDGVILGGHLRRLALTKLQADGEPEPQGVQPGWLVPCRVFTGTEAQELALLTGDNPQVSELDYDNEALTALLSELQAQDALAGAGYDDADLTALLAELNAGSGGGSVDPNAEWDGMPEFEQPDMMPFRTLNVHFADDAAAQDFAKLIGQTLTEKTKYVWHPAQIRQDRPDYVSDEP